jgi:hypothetical protein
MLGVQVFDLQEDSFEVRACFVFRFEKPSPHVMTVVVNDE